MKSPLVMAFVAATTLVGGCQAMKEGDDNMSTSFQQPNKRIVQQKIDELLALSGVEVRWNKYQGDIEEDMFNLVLSGEGPDFFDLFDPSCTPHPTVSYPRTRRSVRPNDLYTIAMLSGVVVAGCDADSDVEVYQVVYKGVKRGLEVLQQLELLDFNIPGMRVSVIAPWTCLVDAEVQEYKQENPGRPVDAKVLGWLKDNIVLKCDHYTDDDMLESRLRSQIRQDSMLDDEVNISVTSFNGIVLLTGEVNTDEQRMRAGEIVQGDGSTRKLVNELQLAGKINVVGRANDALLTGKIEARLLKTENTAPTIKVVTEHGKVYLLGLVTQAEADAAVEAAQEVRGVTHIVKVFEYIE